MKKVIVAVIVVLALLPLLPMIVPKPLTIERIEAGLQQQGFSVSGVEEAVSPMLEADHQWTMLVDGATTDAYFYSDRGKIAKHREYQRKDAGTAIVETWNLSESLGAAPNRNIPTFVGRKGMVLLIVKTHNDDLGQRVVAAFQGL